MRYYVRGKDDMQLLFDESDGYQLFYYEIDDDSPSFEKYYHRELINKRLKYLGTPTQELHDDIEMVISDIIDATNAISIEFTQTLGHQHLFHYDISFYYDDEYIYGVFDCDRDVALCIFDSLEEALCFIPQPYEKNSLLQMHVNGQVYEALYVDNYKVRLQRSEYRNGKCEFCAMEDISMNTFNEWLRQKTIDSIEWEEY